MQAGEATMVASGTSFPSMNSPTPRVARFFVRLFGCWHKNMGRPITSGGETYRACLDCGARRPFDTNAWNMYGPYYY